MKRIFLSLLAVFGLTITQAQEQPNTWEKWGPTGENGSGVIVRAGYTIGGTSPIPLPNEIRSINEFSPKGGATVGMDVYKMFSRRWGVALACRFFYEGFHTGADVKNYKISLTMEGNTMAGYFTGTNAPNTEMWG
ncbi:MAG: PorT family protein, partial [Bacteroidaceae bacterium]|nr:PorT family protein [Bacteroidaceae bacterium]